MTHSIRRKIFFFKIRNEKKLFKRKELLQEVRKLIYVSSQTNAYKAIGDGEDLVLWEGAQIDGNVRLIFARVRNAALPEVLRKNSNNVSPLQVSPDEALVEKVHLTIYPNGILGAEFNFYGPRVTQLPSYLRDCCGLGDIVIEPFANKEFRELIANMGDAKKLTLSVCKTQVAMLRPISKTLEQSVDALASASGTWDVEIILNNSTVDKTVKRPSAFPKNIATWIENFGKHPKSRSAVDKLEIRAVDTALGRMSTFDLLSDKIMQEVSVETVDSKHRTVDSAKMFAEIDNAREIHRDVLDDLNKRYERQHHQNN